MADDNAKSQQSKQPDVDRRRALTARLTYESDLPPPGLFRGYEETLPGAADRIMKMAERQADHEIKQEDKAVSANISSEKLGMIFALIVSISIIAGGVYLIVNNKEIYGLLAIASTVAANFFTATQRKQKKNPN